jgi:hypothetical protein
MEPQMENPAGSGSAREWIRRGAAMLAVVALSAGLGSAGMVKAGAPPPDDPDCEARLEAAVQAISTHPRVKGIPRDKLKATAEFTTGNMLFVLLHEAAHGLISDLGLPVLGREEDAADAFATVAMLDMKTEFTHRTLVNAAKSWMISDLRDRDNHEDVVYYDVHGLDLQRAYNIICLMVGSNPDRFEDLAREVNLPEDRRESCRFDYSNASWSWDKALKPYLRGENQERTKYEIIYGKAEGSLDIFEQALRVTEIVERVGDRLADIYAWKKPFAIEVKMCGDSSAQWSVIEHKVILCYELADEFVQLYKQYGEKPLTALSPRAGSRSSAPLGYR